MSKEFKILSPTAILGYGFPVDSFMRGMDETPDLIAVDAGSVDPGPFYLGHGKSFTDRTGVKRDLQIMLTEGVSRGIPVVIGSAGGCGAAPHLQWCREIIEEIAQENGLSFRMGLIWADIDKELIVQAIQDDKIVPTRGVSPLTEKVVSECSHIVAQMGIEPIVEAIKEGCQVILAGRAYDPAAFAALPISQGYDPALALHLGKILECAAIAAEPGSGSDSVLGILKEDSFVLKPLSDERRFTKESVAAHSLYEKSDPYCLPGPGGSLDLGNVTFEEIGSGQVQVSGTKFLPSDPYTVKLEGARRCGYRTITIAGVRDPIMIGNIDTILDEVKQRVDGMLEKENIAGQVNIRIYGKNGVMGPLEPNQTITSHEIGILIEAVSETQQQADTMCSIMRSTLLHYGYSGRIATAGNLAFPFSPSDIQTAPVYEFAIYHLMSIETEQMQTLFPVEVIEIGGSR